MTYAECLTFVKQAATRLIDSVDYNGGVPFHGHMGDACIQCVRDTLKSLVIERGGITVDGLRIGVAVTSSTKSGLRASSSRGLKALIDMLHQDIFTYVNDEVMRRWENAQRTFGTYQPLGEADEVAKFQNEKFRGFD